MKHKFNKILLAIAVVATLNVVFTSCKKDFLNVPATGQLTEELLHWLPPLKGCGPKSLSSPIRVTVTLLP